MAGLHALDFVLVHLRHRPRFAHRHRANPGAGPRLRRGPGGGHVALLRIALWLQPPGLAAARRDLVGLGPPHLGLHFDRR